MNVESYVFPLSIYYSQTLFMNVESYVFPLSNKIYIILLIVFVKQKGKAITAFNV